LIPPAASACLMSSAIASTCPFSELLICSSRPVIVA